MAGGFAPGMPAAGTMMMVMAVQEDPMRAYRACLHCRGRKTKCNLEANGGRPPCKRCQREQRDCVLGESHRGGRRERKKKPPEVPSSKPPKREIRIQSNGFAHDPSSSFAERPSKRQAMNPETFDASYVATSSWQNTQPQSASQSSGLSRPPSQNVSPGLQLYHPPMPASMGVETAEMSPRGATRESLAVTDLQNPSDALEILARVADRAEGGSPASDRDNVVEASHASTSWRPPDSPSRIDDRFHYKPLSDGLITPNQIYSLFTTYQTAYHPFFPIVPRETFSHPHLPRLSHTEPHLFSAILTIASKDLEPLHKICHAHMQSLTSLLLAGADASIDAVEALLLLSQWVSHRPQTTQRVGRGEEDRVAWMCIGTALRLAYFLGLDRTSFRGDLAEDPGYHRRRLVWSACYVCDRAVSVRLGRGFWARGPGPLSGSRSEDWPTLQPGEGEDDWARIYQANLELTQIFGNVYDILYSSKTHGWRQMLEGRYAKYLDDFRGSIRNWNDTWGNLSCSPRLKASLILTYEYLRLYANAFAYQATISRALLSSRPPHSTLIPFIDAAAPDARFIYDAIDAAKSLLGAVNALVSPATLRYMPSAYYLYIIYSAVFLYKAASTTSMMAEERAAIGGLVGKTIERLRETSTGANQMGSRYARLLQMLWRKTPGAEGEGEGVQMEERRFGVVQRGGGADAQFQPFPPTSQSLRGSDEAATHAPGGAAVAATGNNFSWLDLSGAWSFAMQNQSCAADAVASGGMEEVWGGEGGGSAGCEVKVGWGGLGFAGADYALLSDDDPNLIF